ncbi:MAG TPA: trypsin-like peptidase domain-containing protein [Candidatus Paceibacterota bacterium]|jgi:hypothetical protein|nr:trypsin-like peptidase domain-containing protein [Candidatus Paceibacterota bacterium]
MDIEKLTKSQIVLLTLLVSFVTSIATGIVTVSLMQQAPPAIAETVNRVIENTIETVATSTRGQAATIVSTQQKTIIVNEADLIAQAVKGIAPSVVKIYSADTDQPQFLGLGVVTNASGTVAADIGALGDRPDATVVLQGGTKVRSFVTSRDPSSGLLYLTPGTSTPQVAWTAAPRAVSDPVLGAVVVSIFGQSNAQIAQGIVTELIPADESTKIPEAIVTSIDPSFIQDGSVIIDTNGNVVGVSTGVSRASSPAGFVPASLIGTANNQ